MKKLIYSTQDWSEKVNFFDDGTFNFYIQDDNGDSPDNAWMEIAKCRMLEHEKFWVRSQYLFALEKGIEIPNLSWNER
jgi:hypothetical protein